MNAAGTKHVDGQFARAVRAALTQRGWSILKLSEELDVTYEHVRKIVHGIAFPSRHMLQEMGRILGLDSGQMQKYIVADKIERKFGSIPLELAGKNPRFVRLERLLPSLTDEQFSSLMAIAEDMFKRNLSGQKTRKGSRH